MSGLPHVIIGLITSIFSVLVYIVILFSYFSLWLYYCKYTWDNIIVLPVYHLTYLPTHLQLINIYMHVTEYISAVWKCPLKIIIQLLCYNRVECEFFCLQLHVWQSLEEEKLKGDLQQLLDQGIRSLAVVLMHSYMWVVSANTVT